MDEKLMEALNELILRHVLDESFEGLAPLRLARTDEGGLYIGNGEYGVEIDPQGGFCVVGG